MRKIPLDKCFSCGHKRRLVTYRTKWGKEKRLCENCLLVHYLFEDVSRFTSKKNYDVFARLNAFYSYKSQQKDQVLFKLFLRYLWQIENPNITAIKRKWKRHYKNKSDPIEKYIKRFQRIGILGDITKIENDKGEEDEIAVWGDRINDMLHQHTSARTTNDVDSWFYNIANIIKCAESLIGLSTELDRPTFDKNRDRIMKFFAKACCDKDGYLKDECKKNSIEKYRCTYKNEAGEECGQEWKDIDEIIDHLNEHGVSREDKEKYYEPVLKYKGVWFSSNDFTKQGDRLSYMNWQNAVDALIKGQDFFIDLGQNPNTGKREFIIHPDVADAMEKALIKTKLKIKELKKVKEKTSR